MVKINFSGDSNTDKAAAATSELSEDQWAEIEAFLEKRNKIGAIKLVHEWQRCSLAQAKQFVEQHQKKLCELDPARFGNASASGCGTKAGILLFTISLVGLWVVLG